MIGRMKEITILKDRPSQNNSLTDINMQANEQTNFDRQDVKRDDLEDKLDMAANNFNQNRVEEHKKSTRYETPPIPTLISLILISRKRIMKIPNPTKAIDIRKFYFESTTNAIVKPRS